MPLFDYICIDCRSDKEFRHAYPPPATETCRECGAVCTIKEVQMPGYRFDHTIKDEFGQSRAHKNKLSKG